MVLRKPF